MRLTSCWYAAVLAGLWGPLALAFAGYPQELPRELAAGIDEIVSQAYSSAAAGLPCELKSRGKPKMLRWEEVDRCLNDAANRVDSAEMSRRLAQLQSGAAKVSPGQFERAVAASLEAHALLYERVFNVKNPEVLLPLTNSLLKYLPAGSLENLPVTDKYGTDLGTFAGTYAYERTGGLASANTYRLALFQYRDRDGNIQTAADKLLLDSFGVPWKSAMAQPGFCLPSDRLK